MKGKGGFTLIELVVVLVLIGILMAVAIPYYVDLTDKAKEARDKETLAGLRTTTVLLYASNQLNNVRVAHTNAGNSLTNYWPSEVQVRSNMTDYAATTNWQYYTSVVYIVTNGIWRALP